MSKTRTWPDPQVSDLERVMVAARRRRDSADRIYRTALTDREQQLIDEERIARDQLGEPFYYPKDKTDKIGLMNDLKAAGNTLVRRWVSDADLAEMSAALEAAEAACAEAEAAFEEARAKAKPISETKIRTEARKVKAQYAVNRDLTVSGVRYTAGQPLPLEVSDSLDFWKVRRWLDAALIREI